MMNFRHVEVFHAIYTNGTVSAAARALSVAQPTVSKILRHAESVLGYVLFHRAGGRLVPTDEAHALFREVDEIYDKMLALRRTSTNIGRRSQELIRFAVLPGFGLEIAPRAVAAFHRTHPKVVFDIQTRHTADFLRTLQEKECDIVIGYEAPSHPQLSYHDIGEAELVLVHRRGDLPETPGRVALDIIEKHDFITVAPDSGPLGRLLAREIDHRNLAPKELVTISTSYIATSLVREGLGIAVVDSITAHALCGGDLGYRGFDPPLTFNMCCVTLADRPLPKILRRFLQTLRDTIGNLA